MRKEDKTLLIENLAAQLVQTPNFYVVDTAGLNAERTTKLRRECFTRNIKWMVVKNTLLRKALEKVGNAEAAQLFPILEGPTSVFFTETANLPAKLIKEFGKQYGKPLLKGACLQECAYIGSEHLDALVNIKSREELIGDIVALLQTPARNIISALTSGGAKLAGIADTLAERNS
ncbi:MAG: 50S ribosomal protein L10 [Bacteroidetes bacterium]|nr:50S ribosomal protein L10 [Bacteroidota bacterium]